MCAYVSVHAHTHVYARKWENVSLANAVNDSILYFESFYVVKLVVCEGDRGSDLSNRKMSVFSKRLGCLAGVQ